MMINLKTTELSLKPPHLADYADEVIE